METQETTQVNPMGNMNVNQAKAPQKKETDFHSIFHKSPPIPSMDGSITTQPTIAVLPTDLPLEPPSANTSNKEVIDAYKKHGVQQINPDKIDGLAKYKDDQLLSNPGGDHYYLGQKRVVPNPKDQESFWGRLGKDLSDAFGNIKNFFHNIFLGSKVHYRDKDNQIRETTQRGFFGSIGDFFKDLGSALTFGMWRPDGEKEPQGFVKRVGFFFSKMKEAFFGDLIQGVSGSVIHMGEDLLFAGWNLLETIPDATIGNLHGGRKLTTALFDNGQVVMDYITDILPSCEAWQRVHSPDLKDLKPPILNNINMPEHHSGDTRWQYVRNNPFRKAIETIGALMADVLTLKILGSIKLFSDKHNENNQS